ncbi:hypothetical protein KR054_007594 [Drosophila jambulina]|nr:hypothetical protein KR054_007594 [Drosophila jambulina]
MCAMLKAFAIIFLFVLPVTLDKNVENEEQFDFHRNLYTTSVLGLIELLELEQEFMENFTLYTDSLQEKVNNLNSYLEALKRPRYMTPKDRTKFVSDPLKAFGLIRRLHQDWPKLQNYCQKSVGLVHLNAMKEILTRAPDDHDMNETLKGMHRIETTYDLQAQDIANGLLQGKQFNYKLTSRDCLVLAQHKLESGDYDRSLRWFKAALEHKTIGNDNEESSFETFARAVIKQSNYNIKYYNIFLFNQSSENETIQQHVNEKFQTSKDMEEFINSQLRQLNMEYINSTDRSISTNYNGCRGLYRKRNNRLVCRYNSTTTPFLKLAPLKMEEMSLDPYMVLYHEVVSNREIEDLKGEIKGTMDNGWADLTEVISRVYWMQKESSIRKRINHRITDMTGFDVREFPALQLANFGLGGYFMAHHDYFSERILRVEPLNPLGDRIGSLLIYAGDVSQGGQTLFPEIEVAVDPKKGNALLWFNTFDDATPDPRSLHSVCPVIVGSRWTVIKWLHYAPQLFVKRCYPKAQNLSLNT